MDKIASPQDLQAELRRLLAYSQSERPSRARVASELRTLSERLSSPRTAAYVAEGKQFYELMNAHWRNVKYDEEKGTGTVRAGILGEVEWHESGNDSAVIVEVKAIRMKARPKDAAKALERIAKAIDIGV